MKKILLLVLLCVQLSIAQDIIYEKSSLINIYEYEEAIINFIDHDSIFHLNYTTASTGISWEFSEALKKTKFSRTYKESTSCINPLGSFSSKNTAVYIYTSNNKKRFRAVSVNLNDGSVVHTPQLNLKFHKEKLISAFAYKQQFFLLTYSKKHLKYRFHILDIHLNHNIKEVEIGIDNLENSHELTPQRQEQWLNTISYLSHTSNAVIIENNNAYQNAIITQASKLYINAGKLLLTLDKKKDYTNIIEFSLDTFNCNIKRISKMHFGHEAEPTSKSNSFLFKNLLFVIKGNSSKLNLRIYDYTTNHLVSEHHFDKNSAFSKTENLIVSDAIINQYDLSKAEKAKDNIIKKRLRKVMSGENQIGLRVSQIGNHYLLHIGGYLLRTGNTNIPGMGMGMPGFPGATFGFGFYYSFERDESLNMYLDSSNLQLAFTKVKPVSFPSLFFSLETFVSF